MKTLLLALLIGGNANASAWQVADVEFKDAETHIAVDVQIENGRDVFRFLLRDNVSRKEALISTCIYSRESLTKQIGTGVSPALRSEFFSVLRTSLPSKASLGMFFGELRTLLIDARPDCPVRTLDDLQGDLRSRAG